MEPLLRTERTRVKRLPDRGVYERDAVNAIIDEALYCHVGFNIDGQPFVIPTVHARIEDRLYVHGSAASRLLRESRSGVTVCVTVTLVDGLVLARSAFHHSMNYRSVLILGTGELVTDPTEQMAAFEAITNHALAGRWNDVRWPNEKELKATAVLRLPISEASAKVRSGPPLDDEEDLTLPCWAGVVPLALTAGTPVPDPHLPSDRVPPEGVREYRRE